MDMENVVESAPVESQASEAPVSSPEPSPSAQGPDVAASMPDVPASPYAPDFKFKSLGQDYEIDEEYRGYIKTVEDEKRIKRMFEQFKGVDKLKNEWHEYKNKVQEYEPQVEKLKNYDMSFEAFNKLMQGGQYKRAFDLFQIPKDVMYKAALQYAEYDDLPQQQKEVYSQLQGQEQVNAQSTSNFNLLKPNCNSFRL